MLKINCSFGALLRQCLFFTLSINFALLTSVYAQTMQTWVSSGNSKILQNQLPLSQGASVNSLAWDGTTAHLFGGRNEVIGSALHIEAPQTDLTNLSVTASALTHSSGYTISSKPASGDALFNYVGRNIELFYVRYLQVKGLSQNMAASYDERHLPEVMRRPSDANGIASGDWYSRPGADKFFPDIAVPIELHPQFTVSRGTSQMVWMDVYIPKNAPAGIYTGGLNIYQNGTFVRWVPISLEVYGFTLPDKHVSKTMLAYSPDNLEWRFFGKGYVDTNTPEGLNAIAVRDRYFMMAHRHGIDLVDNNPDYPGTQPSPKEWPRRLSGDLYTSTSGYEGPGVATGNSVFAIGLYGSWRWKNQGEYEMRTNTDAWENWFRTNAPNVERFLYLADEEEATFQQLDQWSSWVRNNPGVGSALKTFATKPLPNALNLAANLTMIGSTIFVGDSTIWQNAMNAVLSSGNKKALMYNGHRPASGTFYLDDDAIGPREIPWGQFKKGIDRWMVWEGTYYKNQNSPVPQTPLFTKAQTFGNQPINTSAYGESGNPYAAGGLYSNSDGVLLYPGKDMVYPDQSYGINGPIASLRMKYWRRGISDVDYLALAQSYNPTKTDEIVRRVVPKALWEYGVSDRNDPSWVRTPISWSSNPDVWESARLELAQLIVQYTGGTVPVTTPSPTPVSTVTPTVIPTATATRVPTVTATMTSSAVPTLMPTARPTLVPTVIATMTPTSVPNSLPTLKAEVKDGQLTLTVNGNDLISSYETSGNDLYIQVMNGAGRQIVELERSDLRPTSIGGKGIAGPLKLPPGIVAGDTLSILVIVHPDRGSVIVSLRMTAVVPK